MVKRDGPSMVLSTEWAQVEYVELTNDGNGLGFNLVGGRSTGVVIKGVQPGGAAERDGRLQSGDHVLQIGSVSLRGYTSEQVAAALRAAGPAVRLLVARPADAGAALRPSPPGTAVVPTRLLADADQLDRHLIENGYASVYIPDCYVQEQYINASQLDPNLIAAVNIVCESQVELVAPVSPTITITVPVEIPDLPEVEIVNVDLNKNVYGLGITVAGYVCEKEELSGIFVKSIVDGSSAEQSHKIRVNDRIIAVDGISLADKTNPQAVDILRNTDISVHLVLERYLRGPKFEHLQLAILSDDRPPSPSPSTTTTLSWFPVPSQVENSTTEIEPEPESSTTIDSSILEVGDQEEESSEPSQEEIDKRLDEILSVEPEEIKDKWKAEVGPSKEVVVVEVSKLSGLGISLEGTVDVEGGQELRPHHYIRSVRPDGPVARSGALAAGDELLEANEHRLHGLPHAEVVAILKRLPRRVRLVCARSPARGPRPVINVASDREGFETRKIISGSLHNLSGLPRPPRSPPPGPASPGPASPARRSPDPRRARSLECVSDLATWLSQEEVVEVLKGEQGLGFSILDYQDPLDPAGTVIVVRGLVPGGAAERGGRVAPGDRVLSVNGASLKNATLDGAVQALKGAARGAVRVGLARPRPPPPAKARSEPALDNSS